MLISLEDILRDQSKIGLNESLNNIKKHYHKLNIESVSTYGDPTYAIRKIADDRQVDLVVLGSRGKSLKDTVYGSTTCQLVRKMTQPLLIVPTNQPVKKPEKIVLATDLIQMEDLNVLNSMLMIARKFNAEIIIINVTGRKQYSHVRQALQRLDFNDHFEGIRSRFEVIDNQDIVAGITDFSAQQQADLLVLSPKRYTYFRNMFRRSITKSVIRHSEIPVMVI